VQHVCHKGTVCRLLHAMMLNKDYAHKACSIYLECTKEKNSECVKAVFLHVFTTKSPAIADKPALYIHKLQRSQNCEASVRNLLLVARAKKKAYGQDDLHHL